MALQRFGSWVAGVVIHVLVVVLAPCPVRAQTQGVTPTEIVIGQSCALSGPASALGMGMRDGALAYFSAVNAKGGIHGRRIRLVSLDDGYEPGACGRNTVSLSDKEKVFLLFGYVGTPTAEAALPIATAKNLPFFAPFTGAEFLRSPLNRLVFNIRASYFQETEAMVERLIKDLAIKRISVFYQNDAYGRAGLEGVRQALARRDLAMVNAVDYPRNTVEVAPAVAALQMTRPDAVIMVGAYAPCAEFIRQMRAGGSQAVFLNVSFVGADALGERLANAGLGVVITQVVPFPYHQKIPVVAEYHRLNKATENPSAATFMGMEGFIAAKALCHILQEASPALSRESFLAAAERQSGVDLGGFSFSFAPDDHQGADLVYFTQIGPGGYVVPINSLKDLYPYRP